ncbi:hypothetical protein MAPG_11325 [Magnaporthiopsis poae ATCC 64411]|uniref:Uncharacterized protein n=1 Tax=Magnaporthiopsis poae (strain ATCC 64411 / 73-15) TaxID=644358 RepID=A0A0C4EEZ3_MAGP6|nr:hypothetical protein MAPG_11325 [Magnaporthiopsis poae ATCC 64411]
MRRFTTEHIPCEPVGIVERIGGWRLCPAPCEFRSRVRPSPCTSIYSARSSNAPGGGHWNGETGDHREEPLPSEIEERRDHEVQQQAGFNVKESELKTAVEWEVEEVCRKNWRDDGGRNLLAKCKGGEETQEPYENTAQTKAPDEYERLYGRRQCPPGSPADIIKILAAPDVARSRKDVT